MKSPNIPKKKRILIKTDTLSHNEEWKNNNWYKIYIVTSYRMMYYEKYWELVIFTGAHFVTQNCQYLVNDSWYEQNQSTDV